MASKYARSSDAGTSFHSPLPRAVASSRSATSFAGPTASMAFAMPPSCGGTICAPLPQYTLYPLYSGGLWLAVTITAAAAPSCPRAKAVTGVGDTSRNTHAGMPSAASTMAVSCANSRLMRRPSRPTTTPRAPTSGTVALR
jgi:hypothetical protein